MIALLLAALPAALFATSPEISPATASRLRVFSREINRAARELRVARPLVNVVPFEEALAETKNPMVAAWVWVPKGTRRSDPVKVHVTIVWSQLMSASDLRLRCWARHEVTHIVLGHEYGAGDSFVAALQHDQVRRYMEARWRQDSACLFDR